VHGAERSFQLRVSPAFRILPQFAERALKLLQLFAKVFAVSFGRAWRHADADDSFSAADYIRGIRPDALKVFRGYSLVFQRVKQIVKDVVFPDAEMFFRAPDWCQHQEECNEGKCTNCASRSHFLVTSIGFDLSANPVMAV
jgi:hypothetical protein